MSVGYFFKEKITYRVEAGANHELIHKLWDLTLEPCP